MEDVLPEFMLMDSRKVAAYDKYLASGISGLNLDELMHALPQALMYLERQRTTNLANNELDEKYTLTPVDRAKIYQEYQQECWRRAMSTETSEDELNKLQDISHLFFVMKARSFSVQELVDQLKSYLALSQPTSVDGAELNIPTMFLPNHPYASRDDLRILVECWIRRTEVWNKESGLDLFSLGEAERREFDKHNGYTVHEYFYYGRNGNLKEIIKHPNSHDRLFKPIIRFNFEDVHLAIAESDKVRKKTLEKLLDGGSLRVRRAIAKQELVCKLGKTYRESLKKDDDPEICRALEEHNLL